MGLLIGAGPSVLKVGETKLPSDQKPLVLHAGELTLETSGGKLATLLLSTHQMPTPNAQINQTECFEIALNKRIALLRYQEAWNTCLSLDQKSSWNKLVDCALKNLEIDVAMRIYRQVGDASMVWSLERIRDVEDKKLLSGHIAMFLQDFDKAQELFLESSNPVQALIMRQDIMQWDQALQLARSLDPSRIPYLSREYAHQLELMGQYTEALSHYERGLLEEVREEEHNTLCRAGIARTAIRCGDYRRGIAMATDPRADVQLKQECAEILESIKKLNEAAMLYERAENFDRAASAYIGLKNWQKVGEILPKVTSSKIHHQFAKVKESIGEYRVARQAYQLAQDLDSVVRLDLEHLNDPQEAVRIVQETRSIEGAKLVAKFFQKIGDYASAIRFLVMSRCHGDAFRLSRDHNQLELYGEILVEESDGEAVQEFLSLAVHFETLGKHFLAGKYYYHAGDYKKAMKYLMMAARNNTEDNEPISLAIEVVGVSNDDVLANQLIELLLGETDGEPRDPKYVFRLYMARRQYREAAKTAIIIAKEEQINGNYRSAHDVLLGMCQELRENNLRISTEMMNNLTLLHSYILVRLHVRLGNHLNAARMLIRVADNISKFPSHIVPILTSAVIECHRADLKARAFGYAAMLMRPEYRSQVEPKYRKKMEGVVRKPPRGANNKLLPDEPEPMAPCPYCGYRLPETELHCTQCKNNIPFCIATGRHVLKDDLTACPNCHFPAIRSELLQIIEVGENCPMCSERIDHHQLKLVHETEIYLLQTSSGDD